MHSTPTAGLARLWLGAIVLLAGCAGAEIHPDAAQERGPLPYHVGIYLDTERLPYRIPAGDDAETPKVRYRGDDEALLGALKHVISIDNPIVSQVEVLSARNRSDAIREAEGLDLLLAVGFETEDEYTEYSRSAAWGTLEVFTFIFGGFPSWFVPTVQFDAPANLTVERLDLHQSRVRRWLNGGGDVPAFDSPASFSTSPQGSSLWDRTQETTDFLLTIVVPPMVVAPGASPNRLSGFLTEAVHSDLGAQLGESLRDQLLSEDWVKPLAVVFLTPNPLELVPGDEIDLELGIANRHGGRLRRLEIARLSPSVPAVTWRASDNELDALAREFAALKDQNEYVRLLVPTAIPVAGGANLVKVLMVHENGEQIRRTMLFIK